MIIENVGTILHLGISIAPIEGFHMDEFNFICKFFVHPSYYITIPKSKMKRVDEDNYELYVDTSLIGSGNIMCKIECDIPDENIECGYRKECVTLCTGFNFV